LSKFFKAFLGMLFLATYVTVSPQAFASTTTVGMPFSGKWAYNVNVNPPYDDSNSSHPSVHWTNATTQYLWGDWASDLYASEGTPVSLHVTSNDGTVSFNKVPYSDGSCGHRLVISVFVNNTEIGQIYFDHLNNVTNSTITNDKVVGYVHDWGGCNPGPHVHFELKNISNYSCYTDWGHPGASIGEGESLGLLGASNTSIRQSCPGSTASSGGNAGTLWFIKTKNTGSGHVEVHSATPGSGYQGGQHSATWFSSAEANNGWFQVAGSNLWFIKTKYTGSGRVEVHSATGASGYKSGVHYASLFSSGEADNGWFQVDDWNRDGAQDLIYIKTRNTGSGRVEIFAADGASGYGRLLVAAPTAFSPGDANNGWFQEQNRDVVFIKTRNTGSGRVEYFRASASSNFSQLSLATPTVFYPYDQNNGWFSSEDVSSDGRADELFIKTHNTGSGHVELFESDGASNYQQLTQATVTWLSPADADNGWFQVNSKQ
jgi:hypothetical protein